MMMSMLYEGEEPYVFVSYSHKDAAEALALIARLMDRGYLVWYDRGNTVGVRWRTNITRHVKACAVFLPIISRNFNESENCLDELATAIDGNKKLVPVFLEDIEPPEEGEMRIRRMQILHRWKYTEEEKFYIELFESKALLQCLSGIQNETNFVGETEDIMKNNREEPQRNVQESLLSASGWTGDWERQKEQVLPVQNQVFVMQLENKAEVVMPRSSPAAENARTGAASVMTLPKVEFVKTAEDFREIPEVQPQKRSFLESLKNLKSLWKKPS